NQPGEIATLARISRPTVGVVTTVSNSHTEFFGSVEGVQAEKSELVRAVSRDGAVVLNAEDARVLAMRDLASARVLTFSLRAPTDIGVAGPISEGADGLRFMLLIAGAERSVRLRFAGRH